MYPLTEVPALDDQERHTAEVVVDRLTVKASSRARLTDSVETALKLADGRMTASFVDLPEGDPDREHRYSERLDCPNGHPLATGELEPRSFSFNSPFGACPVCDGLGIRRETDPELVVPDGSLSLARGAIAPWAGWKEREYFQRLLRATADAGGFGMDTPWDELTDAARQAVLHGTGNRVHVSYRTRAGRERSYYVRFEGVLPWIERRYAEAEPDGAGETYQAFMRAVPCPACGGARLAPEILAVTVDGRSIADLAARPVREAAEWLRALALSPREQLIAERPLSEIQARLGFLADVGLGYLSLDRPAATLAGGEAQRIRLATQIGSGLTGVLYVLDEPSIGLHQRDNQRLIETLTRLRDLGNTLIVVEHDEDTIAAADWVVDIGPQAGEHGGRVVVSGTVEDLKKSPESITGAYLSGRTGIEVPADPTAAAHGPRAGRRGRARAQPARHRRRGPAGLLRGGDGGVRIRQIIPGQRHRLSGTGQPHQRNETAAGPSHPDHGNRPARQGGRRRPVADRAEPAVEPGDVHRRVRLHPGAVRRDDGGEGPRLPAGPVLLQREGRPVRELRG